MVATAFPDEVKGKVATHVNEADGLAVSDGASMPPPPPNLDQFEVTARPASAGRRLLGLRGKMQEYAPISRVSGGLV